VAGAAAGSCRVRRSPRCRRMSDDHLWLVPGVAELGPTTPAWSAIGRPSGRSGVRSTMLRRALAASHFCGTCTGAKPRQGRRASHACSAFTSIVPTRTKARSACFTCPFSVPTRNERRDSARPAGFGLRPVPGRSTWDSRKSSRGSPHAAGFLRRCAPGRHAARELYCVPMLPGRGITDRASASRRRRSKASSLFNVSARLAWRLIGMPCLLATDG